MRARVLLLAFAMELAAGALWGVGQHDGVLGATPPDAFPSPGQDPVVVTTRIVVEGTTVDGARALAALPLGVGGDALDLPEAAYVPARFETGLDDALVLLRVHGVAPAVGQVLVVEGAATTFRLDAPEGGALVVLEPGNVRAPIVF